MGNWRKMNFIVLGIWNLRHVFTRDPWFWWTHGWMNMKEKRESERERMLAESSGIDQMEQSYIWESTLGFHLYYSVTNQLLVCLKFSSLYVVWVSNEKWQTGIARTQVMSTRFLRKKIAATLTVLTKCSHYKLLLLLLYLHVCVCTAK